MVLFSDGESFDETPWFLEVIFAWHVHAPVNLPNQQPKQQCGWPRRHENIEKHFRFCVTEIFLVKKTIFVYHFSHVVACFLKFLQLDLRFGAFHGFTSDSIWTLLPSGNRQSALCTQRTLGKSVSISLVGIEIFFSLAATPNFDCFVSAGACQGVGIQPADCN